MFMMASDNKKHAEHAAGGKSPSGSGEFSHVSVLPDAVLEVLQVSSGGLYVDCTFGGGGHTRLIANHCAPDGRVIAIDKDGKTLEQGREKLGELVSRVDLRQGNFSALKEILNPDEIGAVDGIVADLGLSSIQLDDPNRGFSFSHAGPLDMRMDQRQTLELGKFLQEATKEELARCLAVYGEERFANRIAAAIKQRMQQEKLQDTGDLAQVIGAAIPRKAWPKKIHPATKSFMALRMAVNRELESLEKLLDQCLDVLKPGGVFAVISFHSLEDRMVRDAMRAWAQRQTGPRRLPVPGFDREPDVDLITRKPVVPSEEETESNPRARSAKLRAVRKR